MGLKLEEEFEPMLLLEFIVWVEVKVGRMIIYRFHNLDAQLGLQGFESGL